MADLDTEVHLLGEAEVRLALIRRQIEDVEGLIEQTHDARILNSYRRTLQLLIRTQQAFASHKAALLDSVERLHEHDPGNAMRNEVLARHAPRSSDLGTSQPRNWEQWHTH